MLSKMGKNFGKKNGSGYKNLLYLVLALAMLIYAVPRLDMGQGWTLPTLFGVVWLGIVLLIVSAHLHTLLRVDEEQRQELQRVREYRKFRFHQMIQRKVKAFNRQ